MKAMMCLGILVMLAGCDSSKAELDSTKVTLANVTKERDDLKAQVTNLQEQLTTAKADLTKEKAAEATMEKPKSMMAAKTPSSSSAAKHKKSHKS
jgi:Rab interacting lysosomal protein